MNSKKVEFLIVGAGPTGLGSAWRLNELGHTDWLICEQNDHPGGLAASVRDSHGFLWDFAVHVAHSHYAYFDRLMDSLLPGGFYHLQRKSWIRLYNSWVPYPFQYNFRHLPVNIRDECLKGLMHLQDEQLRTPITDRKQCKGSNAQRTFLDWIMSSFGEGIAKHFMVPYNRKIWTVDPSEMGTSWLGDRVPSVDVERVKKNIEQSLDDIAWGPNATFLFPKIGGTGAIWQAMFARLPVQNKQLSIRVITIDPEKHVASLSNGAIVRYKHLISTAPLPILARLMSDSKLEREIAQLKYSHVQVAGVGVYAPIPNAIKDKTWVYCPEKNVHTYRVTPFSTFSPDHTPDPDHCCSFLCEYSSPGECGCSNEDIGSLAVHDLRTLGLMDIKLGQYHTHIMKSEYGYPVPTINRDEILHRILPELEARSIYSRGRFGGWKYEVANMDHSVMQGVEAVNHVLHGSEQPTIYHPEAVNCQ